MESIRKQIEKLKPMISVKTEGIPVNSSQWKKEGEDHINILVTSNAFVGRALSLRNIYNFEHPILGSFSSLNNLWFFVTAKNPDDQIRSIENNRDLRTHVANNGGTHDRVPNFYAVMMHSAYLRILSMPAVMKAVIESDLPFDCYRKTDISPIRQRFKYSSWVIRGYEEIRSALKERREPDLLFLTDRAIAGDKKKTSKKTVNLYHGVLSNIIGETTTHLIDISGWIADRWERYDAYVEHAARRDSRKKNSLEVADIDTHTTPQDILPAEQLAETETDVMEVSPVVDECTGELLQSDAVTVCNGDLIQRDVVMSAEAQ